MGNQKKDFTAPFILELFKIVNDQNNLNIIKWTQEGSSFVVLNPKKLELEILTKYFKHNHYSSFLRQLNMYHFRKIRDCNNNHEFINKYFQKDREDLLHLIKRHKYIKKVSQIQQYDELQNNLKKDINDIKNEQIMFEDKFSQIVDQHQEILEQNKMILESINDSRIMMNNKFYKLQQLINSIVNIQEKQDIDIPISSFFQDQSQVNNANSAFDDPQQLS